ncbi:cytochrome B [bacterium (candidate division B38) B3_B38]|nr:MAG: cytochrome B [bacterium (candidate division B38) B3_B38]
MSRLKRLYQWVLHWAETPYGSWALFLLAVAESSFFPVPPDVLLIALAISKPLKSFKYALICTLGSVIGGVFGYMIGVQFFSLIGEPILNFYGIMDKYYRIQALYIKYNALAVGIAGFSPIPYKVFTIAAGACRIDFTIFMLASAVSRAGRFFLVGGLLRLFGPQIRGWIEKYLNLLTLIFVILLVGGFIIIRYFLK